MTDIKKSTNVCNKYNVIKYLCIVFSCIYATLMFFKWFEVIYLSNVEMHSYITITSLVNYNIGTFKSLLGNKASFVALLFVATLEYLCIMCGVLGVCGAIRSLVKNKRSKLLFASQLIAFLLVFVALGIYVVVNYISGRMLGGLVNIYPTVYFVICSVTLCASTVLGCVYLRYVNKEK